MSRNAKCTRERVPIGPNSWQDPTICSARMLTSSPSHIQVRMEQQSEVSVPDRNHPPPSHMISIPLHITSFSLRMGSQHAHSCMCTDTARARFPLTKLLRYIGAGSRRRTHVWLCRRDAPILSLFTLPTHGLTTRAHTHTTRREESE